MLGPLETSKQTHIIIDDTLKLCLDCNAEKSSMELLYWIVLSCVAPWLWGWRWTSISNTSGLLATLHVIALAKKGIQLLHARKLTKSESLRPNASKETNLQIWSAREMTRDRKVYPDRLTWATNSCLVKGLSFQSCSCFIFKLLGCTWYLLIMSGVLWSTLWGGCFLRRGRGLSSRITLGNNIASHASAVTGST